MKKLGTICMFFFLMIISKTGYAQMEESQDGVTNIFKLNFLMPGVSYEQKMAQYSAIYFATNIDALILSENETTTKPPIHLTPSFKAEFRNYYNINKRERKGLRTEMNSANYIAPLYIGKYSQKSDYEDREWVSQMGVVWGMQRNAPKGFSLDLNMGLVYTFDAQHSFYYAPISPIIQLTLGFWMGPKS